MNKIGRISALFVLAVVSVFAFCGFAEAALTISAGPLTAELPQGWSVTEGDGQITFMAPANAAALTIVMDSLDGAALEEIAQAMSFRLKGGTPQKHNNFYSFDWQNKNGLGCMTYVMANEKNNVFITLNQIGSHPDMQGLIGSLNWNW